MNKRCDLCKHWDYHYPDDMGTCNNIGTHGVGLHVGWKGGVDKTSCDTYCDNWESDGTELAESVK